MKHLFSLCILSLCITTMAYTQPPCGEPVDLRIICSQVLNRLMDEQGSGYAYKYERILYQSACVDWKTPEPDESISKKVNEIMNSYPHQFKCAGLEYPGASILVAAIKGRMVDFIADATTIWRINVNIQDKYDNDNTALDYLNVEIKRHQGNPVESIMRQLNEMKELLVDHGAKTKNELGKIRAVFIHQFGYEDAKHIAHGMLLVKKAGKWGIVTEENKVVVPTTYYSISYFTPYSAKVSGDGVKWHYINLKNEIIKDPWGR